MRIGGSERLSFKEACQWLAQTPDMTARKAREIMFRLVFDEFLAAVVVTAGETVEVTRDKWKMTAKGCTLVRVERAEGKWKVRGGEAVDMDAALVVVPAWNQEQHEAPSDEAERKRRQRGKSGLDGEFEEESRGDFEEFLSDGSSPVGEFPNESLNPAVTCPGHVTQTVDCTLQRRVSPLHCRLSAPAVPPAPPPQVRSRAEQDSREQDGAGPQARPTQNQSQNQTHSQNQTALGSPAGQAVQEEQFGGGAGGTAGHFVAGGMMPGDDLYRMDPIDAYCTVLGDRKPIAQRNAKSKLRMMCVAFKDDDLGRQKFLFALATMRDILKAGTMPEFLADGSRCLAWKYFEGVFNNVLHERSP